MRFETQFLVQGRPAEVIERFADVPAMASLVPGASVGSVNADGSFPATLVVSFGPKRIAFKGTISNTADRAQCCGVLSGRASADMRAAKMAVKMTYTLSEAAAADPGAAAGTRVGLVSEAELTGVLAEFAKAGGTVVTNAILAEFARGFAARYGGTEKSPNADGAQSNTALSPMLVVRSVVRDAVVGVKRSIGKLRARPEGDSSK